MHKSIVLLIGALWLAASRPVFAAELPSVSFTHNDWELTCDNTRTCRAAGYQADDNSAPPVSVLLMRDGGPGQPLRAQLQLGSYEDAESAATRSTPGLLRMKIDGRALGTVNLDGGTTMADLSPEQVDALVAALGKDSVLEWSAADTTWTVSSKGAAAVLLKMDEFQGRTGTPGALLRKGGKPEDGVLPALPAPVVVAAALARQQANANLVFGSSLHTLLGELRKTAGDDCPEFEGVKNADELAVARLSKDKLLVWASCSVAAYNAGDAYWVINATAPYAPVLVTGAGSDYEAGTISSAQKGRALGDCWNTEEWTWDGRQFVHTASASTGMCRLVAPGGAWHLPELVTDVRKASAK